MDVLKKIEEQGVERDFAYCESRMSRWEGALRLGVIGREKDVVEYALANHPGPIAAPDDDDALLETVLQEEPSVSRALRQFRHLEVGPVSIAGGNGDFPMAQILLNHETTPQERMFAVQYALTHGTTDISRYLVDRDPELYVVVLGCATRCANLAFLQTLIDSKRSNMDPWHLHEALEQAAAMGKNASIHLLLRPGNRELNTHLLEGKGDAFYVAAREGELSSVPDLIESDADINNALRIAVMDVDGSLGLEKLLQWIADQKQTVRKSNPFIVPAEPLIRQAIDRHGSDDWVTLELIVLLCQ